MATDRQIAANQLNALKSTGPRSAEGKLRSRSNSFVHGMAGASGFVEDGMTTAFEARRAEWVPEYRPEGETSDFAMDRLVAASLRIEQCERAVDAIIVRHSLRADRAWEQDARREAATLAAKLSKDPLIVARALEATRHGCELMIELWGYLGKSLDAKRDWSEAETTQALDLLGVPIAVRENASPLDSANGQPRFDHLHPIVLNEVKRLEALIEIHGPIDHLDRQHAKAGDVALLSKPAMLIARYERDAWRRFKEATKTLRTADTLRMAMTDPKPVAKPPLPPPSKPLPEPEPYRNEVLDNVTDPDLIPVAERIRKVFAEGEARRARLVEEFDARQSHAYSYVGISASRDPQPNRA